MQILTPTLFLRFLLFRVFGEKNPPVPLNVIWDDKPHEYQWQGTMDASHQPFKDVELTLFPINNENFWL